jgi:hypothetical protein
MSDKQILIDLGKNAQEIIDYYKEFSKDGVIGAGEFMGAAAAWDFNAPTRPSERKIIKDKYDKSSIWNRIASRHF